MPTYKNQSISEKFKTEFRKIFLAETGIVFWNPESHYAESKFHLQRLESSTCNLESTAWNPETKTACLGFLSWGETTMQIVSKPGNDR